MRTIKRREGRGINSRHGVGNGLDRGRVDVVVDDVDKMPACDNPTPDTNNDKQQKNS